jgi:hypothetical protein
MTAAQAAPFVRLFDLSVLGDNEVLFTGWRPTTQGTVQRWDGAAVTEVNTLPRLCTRIWAADLDHYSIITENNQIHQWSVDSWTVHAPALTSPQDRLEDIDGSSANEVYAISQMGELWRYDGAAWSLAATLNPNLSALWVAGPGNVFIGGFAEMWHFDGTVATPVDIELDQRVNGIHGSSTSDAFVATVDSLHHFDGTAWAPVDSSGGNLTSVFTTSTDVFFQTISPGGLRRLRRPQPW